MSYVAKGEKEYDATGAPVPAAKLHKIRITLTSSNVRNLEKCASLTIFEFTKFSDEGDRSLQRLDQPC